VDLHLYDSSMQLLASATGTAAGHASLEGSLQAGASYLVRAVGNNASLNLSVGDQPRQFDPLDVNHDGLVSPLDALIVINELNAHGTRLAPSLLGTSQYEWDVNRDGSIAPLDVLTIINRLNGTAPAQMSLAQSAAADASDLAVGLEQDRIAQFKGPSDRQVTAATDAVFEQTPSIVLHKPAQYLAPVSGKTNSPSCAASIDDDPVEPGDLTGDLQLDWLYD
jgi:hypothetical protein